jgi:hypothetical protein
MAGSKYGHRESCEPGCTARHTISLDESQTYHEALPGYSLACGLSPSGKPVPIRVDEDGYVLARPIQEEPC